MGRRGEGLVRGLGGDARGRAISLAAAALCFAFGVFPLSNSDTYGHLAQGRYMARHGLPKLDPFSYLQSEPLAWVNYEWLSDGLTWWVFEIGGANSLILVKCVLLAVVGWLLVRQPFGDYSGLTGLRAALLCLALPAARFRFTARPHLVSLLFGTLYLALLTRAIEGRLSRAQARVLGVVLVALHVVWINLHGSHLLGLGLSLAATLAVWIRGGDRRLLSLIFVAQAAASGLSPYGYAIVWDAIDHVVDPAYRELVSEWQPYLPTMPLIMLVVPTLWTVLLLAGVRTLMKQGARGLFWTGTAVALAVLSFRSVRFVGDYLLLTIPTVASGLWPAGEKFLTTKSRRWLSGVGLAAALVWLPLGVSLAEKRGPFRLGEDLRGMPVACAQWLEQHWPESRVLARMDVAWFLLYGAPRAKQLIDGRVPFYGPAHVASVAAAWNDVGRFAGLLQRYRVDAVVVRHSRREDALALAFLAREPGFQKVLVENDHTLFVRSGKPGIPNLSLQQALPSSFGLDALYADDPSALRRGLQAMSRHPNTNGFRAWNRALLAMRSVARPGWGNGLRAPGNAEEARALRDALAQLDVAIANKPHHLPVIDAYRGLALVTLGDLQAAEEAFDRAGEEAVGREVLLGRQELALRRGKGAEVRQFLQQASQMPQAADDVWIGDLRRAVDREAQSPEAE